MTGGKLVSQIIRWSLYATMTVGTVKVYDNLQQTVIADFQRIYQGAASDEMQEAIMSGDDITLESVSHMR